MAQYTKSVQAGTYSRIGAFPAGRAAMLIAAAFAILVIAFAVSAFAPDSEAPATTAGATGELVDGWMPAISAANAEARLAEANAVRDGWSSALLVDEPEVTDGWASYLLRPEPEVVDGWAARYLVED